MLWWLTHIAASRRKLKTYPSMPGLRPTTHAVTSAFSSEGEEVLAMTGTVRLRTRTVVTVAKIQSERASSLPLLRPRVLGSQVKLAELEGHSISHQIKERLIHELVGG
jgi:hypothetical protein